MNTCRVNCKHLSSFVSCARLLLKTSYGKWPSISRFQMQSPDPQMLVISALLSLFSDEKTEASRSSILCTLVKAAQQQNRDPQARSQGSCSLSTPFYCSFTSWCSLLAMVESTVYYYYFFLDFEAMPTDQFYMWIKDWVMGVPWDWVVRMPWLSHMLPLLGYKVGGKDRI